MSWFSLNKAMGTNYTVDPGDIVNTKTALNQLGYYDAPDRRGIDDWTDDAMFNGIKAFQKDNGLKVDGFMRPGGPTETAINANLAAGGENADTPVGGVILAAGRREPNVGIPSQIPQNQRKPDGNPVIRRDSGMKPSYPGSNTQVDAQGNEYRVEEIFGVPIYRPTGNKTRPR